MGAIFLGVLLGAMLSVDLALCCAVEEVACVDVRNLSMRG